MVERAYPGLGSGRRQRAFTLVHRAWRGARINEAVNAVLKRLPPGLERWVERRRTALRVWAGWELVPAEELERSYREIIALLERRVGREAIGDYVEFGVFYGTSLLCMQRASTDAGLAGMRLFGFDSFEGLPERTDSEAPGLWRAGEFAASLASARRRMSSQDADWERITLVAGWYEETLTEQTAAHLGLGKASVVMVDCDLYSSTVPCLRFVEPLIRDEAVILFDDWHSGGLAERGEGERRAFEELLAANPALEVVGELDAYNDTSAVFHVRRIATDPKR